MTHFDADQFRSAAHANMLRHVAGPLASGARETTVPLDAQGVAGIATALRLPLPLLCLRRNLAASELRVSASTLGQPAVELAFAPYSEAGACLPLTLPQVDPVTQSAPGLKVSVALVGSTPFALADLLELRVLEGNFGRLVYLLGSEKARLRAALREIAASRAVDTARAHALDRIGQELGVVRQSARLEFSSQAGALVATTERESDASYRQRLAIHRPLCVPTRAELERVLNGPSALPARIGYAGRFAVQESDAELAVALRIVSPPAPGNANGERRTAFLSYLRDVFLLPLTANDLPPNRLVTPNVRQRSRELLARLQQRVILPAGGFAAPALASALDRVARCRAALGVTTALSALRVQDDAGGSRYELGLGLDLTAEAAADLETMRQNLTSRTFTGAVDAETLAVLGKLTPRTAAEDPTGRWLYHACGLRTVHALAVGRTYVSHFPVHGLVVGMSANPTRLELDARLHAPFDPGLDAALSFALADSDARRGALPAWTRLDRAQFTALLSAATVSPGGAESFASVGLAAAVDATQLAMITASLPTVAPELVVALALDPAWSAGLLSGAAVARTQLRRLIELLGSAGVTSVVPFVSGASVVLAVSSDELPVGATALNARRSQVRWLTLPLEQDTTVGTLTATQGARSTYLFQGPANRGQVAAIVAVAPARRANSDPRFRVDPATVRIDQGPTEPLLDYAQYEYVMNVLDRFRPLGVTVDTRALRERHLDFAHTGTAQPLPLRAGRTYRPFRARRGGAFRPAADD